MNSASFEMLKEIYYTMIDSHQMFALLELVKL